MKIHSPVKLQDSDEEVRLVDDAFGKVCNAVNDLSMRVRMQAAQLLGTMATVSSKFLHQTLDKKLFSNMRVSILDFTCFYLSTLLIVIYTQ